MNPAEIRALARMIDGMDYYRLLRLERKDPRPKVRSAYRRARQRFHPDAHLDAKPEVRDAVDRIARRLTEAYLVLRDSGQRAAYDAGLPEGQLRHDGSRTEPEASTTGTPRAQTANGTRFLNLSLEAERNGDLPKALSHLKMAVTFERSNGSLKGKLESLQAAVKAHPSKNPYLR